MADRSHLRGVPAGLKQLRQRGDARRMVRQFYRTALMLAGSVAYVQRRLRQADSLELARQNENRGLRLAQHKCCFLFSWQGSFAVEGACCLAAATDRAAYPSRGALRHVRSRPGDPPATRSPAPGGARRRSRRDGIRQHRDDQTGGPDRRGRVGAPGTHGTEGGLTLAGLI